MVPPAIQAMPREGKIMTRKGQDVTLRCSGKGNPNPRITWSKKVHVMHISCSWIENHALNRIFEKSAKN